MNDPMNDQTAAAAAAAQMIGRMQQATQVRQQKPTTQERYIAELTAQRNHSQTQVALFGAELMTLRDLVDELQGQLGQEKELTRLLEENLVKERGEKAQLSELLAQIHTDAAMAAAAEENEVLAVWTEVAAKAEPAAIVAEEGGDPNPGDVLPDNPPQE